jgi:transposase
MKAYSLDLRERVAAACAQPAAKLDEVARRFSVSRSFIEKLRRQQQRSGSLAPAGGRRGPLPRLDQAARQQLAACVAAQPAATLAELREPLRAHGGPAVSRTSRWQALQQLALRRKKKPARGRA